MAEEILQERTLTSKAFKNADSSTTYNCYAGYVHYVDKLGDGTLKEIDTTLRWDEERRGWTFTTHSFRPLVPEYADGWIEYRDLFDDKDQTVKYRPICEHILGRLEDNAVIYDDAFGKGMDLVIRFSNTKLKKLVRVRDGYWDSSFSTVFDFEIQLPSGKSIYRADSKESLASGDGYELTLTSEKVFDTSKQTLIGDASKLDGKEWFTYILPYRAWSAGAKVASAEAKIYIKDGKTFLQKAFPAELLRTATGDIYMDGTTNYNAGTGDGGIGQSNDTGGGDWHGCVTAATGFACDYASTTFSDGNWGPAPNSATHSPYMWLVRAFVPINTSAVPSSATITAATFNGYIVSVLDYQGGANSYVSLFQGTQASTSSLATSDYDAFGAEAIDSGEHKALSGIATSAYLTFTLNSTGRGFIVKEGWTKLALRIGFDINDTQPGIGAEYRQHYINWYTADNATNKPYLAVTIADAGPANLKSVNGLAKASVSKINGVSLANIKTINGLS